MSERELSRVEVIERIKTKQLSQLAGAKQLGLSPRQLRRLTRAYEREGAVGLQSRRCGKPSNRRFSDELKQQALSLLLSHYPDFGPTFAHEKLTEIHGLQFSVETLRQWMIEAGLWQGKHRRQAHIHQQRPRRSQRGELVQIDGSPHDWFEGRNDKCCLLVFIDDATSELLVMHFVEQECTQGYFDAIKKQLNTHGVPLAYYSDKHGIFRVNIKEARSGTGNTQLGRALKELNIELICANTPQAKGRVEKANQTLQDRLVKELRLRNISDICTANTYLPEFIQDYNRRFAVKPHNPIDAHRTLIHDDAALALTLSQQHTRKVSKNLQLRYNNKTYQIQTKQQAYSLRGANITVSDNQGNITLLYKGKSLDYNVFESSNQPAPIKDSKQIQSTTHKPEKPHHKPSVDHPWRQYQNTRTQQTA